MITDDDVRQRYQHDASFKNAVDVIALTVHGDADRQALKRIAGLVIFAERERLLLVMADTLRTLMGASAAEPYIRYLTDTVRR